MSTNVLASLDSLETPFRLGAAKPETGPKNLKPKVAQVYFLPPNLQGETTDSLYRRWLTRKAKYITDPFGTVPGFQICSWLVNRCKSGMTPDEFVALCGKIITFRGKTGSA